MTSLLDWLFENATVAATFKSMLEHVASIAKIESSSQEIAFISTIYEAVLPAAYGLLLAFTLYGILTKVMELGDNMSTRDVVMPFIKLILCYLFLIHGGTFIGYILGFSNKLVDAITAVDFKEIAMPSYQELNTGSFFKKIFLLALSGYLGLLSRIGAIVVITVHAISTKVEIVIRMAFLPLAVANICGHEHHGGISYIKRLIASGFFMFIILAIIYITSVIVTAVLAGTTLDTVVVNSATGTGIGNWLLAFFATTIAGPFAACTAVAAAKRTIEEAAG